MGHYTLGTSKMEAGNTEWKRETLHTRCKQDGSRGHRVKAWDTVQCTLVMCKQHGSRGQWVEAWDTTH